MTSTNPILMTAIRPDRADRAPSVLQETPTVMH